VSKRLLDEHVFAGSCRLSRLPRVKSIGSRDDYTVQPGIGQQPIQIVKSSRWRASAVAGGKRPSGGHLPPADAPQPHVLHLSEGGRHASMSKLAGTNDRNVHRTHGHP
jgi:hypothetical protein